MWVVSVIQKPKGPGVVYGPFSNKKEAYEWAEKMFPKAWLRDVAPFIKTSWP